ncbi:MAG: HIT family protein [Dongiaceae bacterium]
MADAGINATMKTFGHPDTVLAEYPHWVVLLRPQQATLGAMVLAARGAATRFSDLDAAALAGLHDAIGGIERTLKSLFAYDKINYLMLMMVDPHVHMHVIPRYADIRTYEGVEFLDPGWPRTPDLAHAPAVDDALRHRLASRLRDAWPRR